jgi:hypothetical protein
MIRKAQPKIMPKTTVVTKVSKRPANSQVRKNMTGKMPIMNGMAENIRSTIKAKMEEAKKKMPMAKPTMKPIIKPMMKPKMAGKTK